MTSTIASSGDQFSFMNPLKFVDHIDWIILRSISLLVISVSFLLCAHSHKHWITSAFSRLSSPFLCFLFVKEIIIEGFLILIYQRRGWHPSMLLLSMNMPLLWKKAITCHSGLVGSSVSVTVTAWAYDRVLVSNLLTIMLFMQVYCSRSATLLSKRGNPASWHFVFSVHWFHPSNPFPISLTSSSVIAQFFFVVKSMHSASHNNNNSLFIEHFTKLMLQSASEQLIETSMSYKASVKQV